MAEEVLANENFDINSLKGIFQNAYLEVKKHETLDIYYIEDKLKVVLNVDENNRFIKYSVVLGTNPKKSELEILKALNLANSEYIMFQISYDDDSTVFISYYLWIEGGVIPKNVVKTYHFFNKVMLGIVVELSEKEIVL